MGLAFPAQTPGHQVQNQKDFKPGKDWIFQTSVSFDCNGSFSGLRWRFWYFPANPKDKYVWTY
jgi:hypothetical protein